LLFVAKQVELSIQADTGWRVEEFLPALRTTTAEVSAVLNVDCEVHAVDLDPDDEHVPRLLLNLYRSDARGK